MSDLQMKAVQLHSHGGVEELRLEDIPRPLPLEDELLIRVHAAGVNPVDAKLREGKTIALRFEGPFPHILGWDVAGVVEAIGERVVDYKIGDSVFGMIRFPSEGKAYAEYVTSPVHHVAHKPHSLTFIQAAALPLTALTAWQALFETAELSEGQKVLIHGASGGVGHLAVQFAKWKGAHVVGTASSRNEGFLHTMGVDEYINYETTDFVDVVEGLDVVFDCVGGETQERSFQVLKPDGFLVTIRNAPSQDKARDYRVRAKRILVRPDADQLLQISELVDQGFVRPHVEKAFPLEEAKEAHRLIEKGHTRGKLVLSIAGNQ